MGGFVGMDLGMGGASTTGGGGSGGGGGGATATLFTTSQAGVPMRLVDYSEDEDDEDDEEEGRDDAHGDTPAHVPSTEELLECEQCRYDSLVGQLQCAICMELFQDPCALPCQHRFCFECITESLRSAQSKSACPQCRIPIFPRDVKRDHMLATICAIMQK